MWNGRSLMRACEAVLLDPSTVLVLRTVSDPATTAHVTYREKPPHKARITIDPAKGGLIESALHEALHVVLAGGLPLNCTLEEVTIRALEEHLWKRTFKGADVARWRRMLNARLT